VRFGSPRSPSRSIPPGSGSWPAAKTSALAPARLGRSWEIPTSCCSVSIGSTTPRGIQHRLQAYEELLDGGRLGPPEAVFVQVASPSRERVQQYQVLRGEVDGIVGRINGNHATRGRPAVHYLHHFYPREEIAANYLAADVMLVTSLRDGMNLVAKEYVASRHDETGALVLSEFTGAADELGSAVLVNPHDIEGMKTAMVHASRVIPRESRRRMRSLRKRVRNYDVNRWASSSFLHALQGSATPPAPRPPSPDTPR
jgi:trehalose-6-phosphate synthase